ncbi:STAS domain-containing protein [Geodermatophilus sp. DSM 44513]|uniref:STAS domain-containing protein n=1 Tax=Geodermatophilus sp. DSM 44513 TaxID=1528104 RepID=UPI00127B9DDD|nr:STAS domain-containing protein [Geodermatophilus sp. DSM 44513]WNV77204.1 STAS domain-containing protein [Geodermatophilus sp. DSM 44513]
MPAMTTCPITTEPAAAGGLLLAVDLAAGRVVLTGELDRATCGQLTAACQVLAAECPPVWVLDVAALDFCDAAGLRALAAARRATEDAGAVALIVGARQVLRRLLPLAGLDDLLAPIARTLPPPAPRHTASSSGVPVATATGTPPAAAARGGGTRARAGWVRPGADDRVVR